jgi:hypothetical protein
VLLDAVGRNADNACAKLPERRHLVSELDILERAALGVVLRIEVEDDCMAAMVR